jgi:hypothetical protein
MLYVQAKHINSIESDKVLGNSILFQPIIQTPATQVILCSVCVGGGVTHYRYSLPHSDSRSLYCIIPVPWYP